METGREGGAGKRKEGGGRDGSGPPRFLADRSA
jgi:hypothetical protein